MKGRDQKSEKDMTEPSKRNVSELNEGHVESDGKKDATVSSKDTTRVGEWT
jgi:hypothetical protein